MVFYASVPCFEIKWLATSTKMSSDASLKSYSALRNKYLHPTVLDKV